MRTDYGRWSRGLAALVLAAWTAGQGAETMPKLTGVVLDAAGRPITTMSGLAEENVLVCGWEKKQADGSWARNRTPHCMLPKVVVDKTGHFTVPVWDEKKMRFNLWVSQPGLAPVYLTVMPQEEEVRVTLRPGLRVSGQVQRRVNGKLEPVAGTNVYLQCASGDLAHQKRVFDEPYWTRVWLNEGDDRPYWGKAVTDASGEYFFHVSPPPKDKKWYLIFQDQFVPLEVNEGQPVKGSNFEVSAQFREQGW